MAESSTPGPLGTAMREVAFPDGSRGIVLVQAGTSQEEAELLGARLWAELPEPEASDE
ncbi:hypothetical protein ACFYO2_14875 [Streptomyces sp. NPDC006602]|uniref:hypothetical protein n=1 Tax=Streptomyces sp. NPDC006602 TaxID=3364751 RepID=UPI00369C5408